MLLFFVLIVCFTLKNPVESACVKNLTQQKLLNLVRREENNNLTKMKEIVFSSQKEFDVAKNVIVHVDTIVKATYAFTNITVNNYLLHRLVIHMQIAFFRTWWEILLLFWVHLEQLLEPCHLY